MANEDKQSQQIRRLWLALLAVIVVALIWPVAVAVLMETALKSRPNSIDPHVKDIHNLLNYRRYELQVPVGSSEYDLRFEIEAEDESKRHPVGVLLRPGDEVTLFVQVDRQQNRVEYCAISVSEDPDSRLTAPGHIETQMPQTGTYISRNESAVQSGDYLVRMGQGGVGVGPGGKHDWELRIAWEPAE